MSHEQAEKPYDALLAENRALRRQVRELKDRPFKPSETSQTTASNIFRLVEVKNDQIAKTTAELEHANRELAASVERTVRYYVSTAIALARLVEARDPHFGAHSIEVGRWARRIGKSMGFDEERLRLLEIAGQLHDFGMIGIRHEVIHKPGPLDTKERDHLRTHVELVRMLLEPIGEIETILAWILTHHERPDGTGYPKGLAGDAIPLEGRILHVADAIEAMGSDRPHRKGLAPETRLKELEAGAGTDFDPEVAREAARLLRNA